MYTHSHGADTTNHFLFLLWRNLEGDTPEKGGGGRGVGSSDDWSGTGKEFARSSGTSKLSDWSESVGSDWRERFDWLI